MRANNRSATTSRQRVDQSKKTLVGALVGLGLLIFVVPVQAEEIYYYHNDHLGTPQYMTDANQNLVWKSGQDPFGADEPVIATVSNNLRFPGQYHDQESGLNYNWNRYYDPQIGRYITSDPIGLHGGINTYVYVDNSPLRYTDEGGLQSSKFKRRRERVENFADLIDHAKCEWFPNKPECLDFVCVRWKCIEVLECDRVREFFIGRDFPFAASPNYDPNDDRRCECVLWCPQGSYQCAGVTF